MRFRRGCVAVLLACSSGALAADSNTILGLHFWGDRNDSAPATLLNSSVNGGYDLEIVNTANPQWNDVDVVNPLYQNFKNLYNITPITRLGEYWGNTLPVPNTADYNNWPSYIANNVVNVVKDTAHLWQLGNEPNLHGEAQNWPNQEITPAQYATVFHNVHVALSNPSLVGQAGAPKLLIAPVSPGTVAGDRWIAGTDWLDQTLSALSPSDIDGIALHAYGGQSTARGSLQDFRKSLLDQIAVIDAHGLTNVPLYITEWNRFTQTGNSADEAVTADFARQALGFINRWNTTLGNHNIVAGNWFVYDSGIGWDNYSIEYFKNNGNPTNSTSSLYNAFFTSARSNYQAGIAGTRPIPTSMNLIDDFETSDGHFAGATPVPASAGGAPQTVGTLATSFKVRQNDADSFTKSYSQKIGINDDPNNPNGWSVRYVSGGGSPSNNTSIPLSPGGEVGFYLRVYTVNGSTDLSAATGLTTQIVLDSGPTGGGVNTDAGRLLNVVADGNWHLYEWNLTNPSDWVPYTPATGSDGKLGVNADFSTGNVSIDSIVFNGGNVSVEYLLDTVGFNNTGSMSVMTIPEPSIPGLMLAVVVAVATPRRRQR